MKGKTWLLIVIVAVLLGLFGYAAFRAGPLAPVAVTVTRVERAALQPGLYGIGTVEARDRYRIGPVQPGRLARLLVDVGDTVSQGQILGEMDPIDLQERLEAQKAALAGARASLEQARSRLAFAEQQVQRYRKLLQTGASTRDLLDAKELELESSRSALKAAEDAVRRLVHEWKALQSLHDNLRLIAPVDGVVVARNAIPGDTVIAGQAVVEIIDPDSLWVTTRFDQIRARGLEAGLEGRILLRSRPDEPLPGRVLRVEPLADAVTEEMIARVVFDRIPKPLPPLGELAEITLSLPALPESAVIPNAALQRHRGQPGVWRVVEGRIEFVPVEAGRQDLQGRVGIRSGLKGGETVVVYSEEPLKPGREIRIVESLVKP